VADATTTTIPLASASGLNDGEAYIVVINRVDANGEKQDTWETVKGVLSGTNLINCVRGVEGTASAWSAGTVVEILMTAEHWNKMVEWAEKEHNQDGTHDNTKVAMLAGSQTFSGEKTFSAGIKTDTVAEKTTDAGVTTDGVKHKDGEVYTDQINEKTSDAGVTIDGVKLKDGQVISSVYMCRAYRSSTQSGFTGGSYTKIELDATTFDPQSMFDSVNHRIVIPEDGYYEVLWRLENTASSSGDRHVGVAYKNGSGLIYDVRHSAMTGSLALRGHDIRYFNKDDYIELYYKPDSDTSVVGGDKGTYIVVRKLPY